MTPGPLAPATALVAVSPKRLQVAHSAAECTVWRRELAFARTLEVHDAAAFAGFLHAGAVFDAGTPGAVRGRDAVVSRWSGLVAGKDVALRWRPGVVNIGGDPDIAVSRGPFALEDLRPAARVRWRVGQFQSVWVRDRRDGVWRVLFDGSAEAPRPVDDAAAAQRHLDENSAADCPG